MHRSTKLLSVKNIFWSSKLILRPAFLLPEKPFLRHIIWSGFVSMVTGGPSNSVVDSWKMIAWWNLEMQTENSAKSKFMMSYKMHLIWANIFSYAFTIFPRFVLFSPTLKVDVAITEPKPRPSPPNKTALCLQPKSDPSSVSRFLP